MVVHRDVAESVLEGPDDPSFPRWPLHLISVRVLEYLQPMRLAYNTYIAYIMAYNTYIAYIMAYNTNIAYIPS